MRDKKIVGYSLCTDYSPLFLEKQVREFLQMGWQPFGGVAIDVDTDGATSYVQALVKYED